MQNALCVPVSVHRLFVIIKRILISTFIDHVHVHVHVNVHVNVHVKLKLKFIWNKYFIDYTHTHN